MILVNLGLTLRVGLRRPLRKVRVVHSTVDQMADLCLVGPCWPDDVLDGGVVRCPSGSDRLRLRFRCKLPAADGPA